MEKKWHLENFAANPEANVIGMAHIMDFANLHGLKPDEFKIGPVDAFGIISVLYFSDRKLPRI